MGTLAGGRGHRRPGPPVHGVGLRGRRPQVRGHHVHLRGQGPGLRPGHPAVTRRRLHHPPARVRHRGLGGRPRRLRTPVRMRAHRGVRLERRGAWPSAGPRTRRWARSAGRWATSSSWTPRPRRSARRPGSTPPGGCSTEPRAIGEIVNRDGVGGFEGYYADEEATVVPDPERLVLDRGPGLPRRGRLLLLRRPARRLDAGGLREPDRRPDRAGAGPPRGRRHRGRLLGARPPLRRPGDGRLRDAPGPCVRPRGLRHLSGLPTRSGHQVEPLVRPDHHGSSPDGQRQGDQGPAPGRGLVGGSRPVYRRQGAASAYVLMGEDDRRSLRAEYLRHGRAGLVGG